MLFYSVILYDDQIDNLKNALFYAQYINDSRALPEILSIHNDDLTLEEFNAMYIKISILQSQVEWY